MNVNKLKELIKSGLFKGNAGTLISENLKLSEELENYKTWAPPGHFYSPIPDIKEIKANEEKIFNRNFTELAGIEMNDMKQQSFLEDFKAFYSDLPFKNEKQQALRYYFNNPNFGHFDAISLYSMIRHLKPKKIIEIGSGYSSCVTLDVNEIFFNNSISCKFIEPYTDLLNSLIKEEDKKRVDIIAKGLQDVELSTFCELSENDILFIDSTHVSKINSDVNYILFQILPVLQKGVYIHFHDIFYPFEYPKEWIYEGRAWNENYILRAFLQYNDMFEIVFFNDYMARFHSDKLNKDLPLSLKNSGGSIWLKKVK